MKGLLATCGFQPGDLYKCYGELSSDIHGGSWSGPSILINKSAMSDKNACLLEALARATNLIPDIVIINVVGLNNLINELDNKGTKS